METRMKVTIELPVKVVKKRKWFVAECRALDVYAQGESSEQARKNLEQSLFLFLQSCIERGTLFDVLRQCGFEPASSTDAGLENASSQDLVNVPLYLLSRFSESRHCHA